MKCKENNAGPFWTINSMGVYLLRNRARYVPGKVVSRLPVVAGEGI